MAKYLMVGVSNAAEGREAEYVEWYDSIHMEDIRALPGVQSAQRLEATSHGLTPAPAKFLAAYEIETDDIAGVMAEMRRRSAAGEIRMSDAIDLASAQLWVYKQQ